MLGSLGLSPPLPMPILRALLGVAVFCFLAWLLSFHRKRFPWRVVIWGVILQASLGGLVLGTELGRGFFEGLTGVFMSVIRSTEPGAQLVFGPLADPAKMGEVFGPDAGFILAFAGTGLPVLLFFTALMAILYHLGIMQLVIWAFARLMNVTMGVSGAEALAMAANVFVGQTEAPLVVRPYVPSMTLSELNTLMVGGFATIAGSVLAVYLGFLGEELGPHLVTASVMSAPAALVCAKILFPETEAAATSGKVVFEVNRNARNVIEAAAEGTLTGLKLFLNVLAMLIAFTALVHFANLPLGWLGGLFGYEGLSLAKIFGTLFAPLAWLMGVDGWHDAELVGSLLGTKIALNELVAYADMQQLLTAEDTFQNLRSAKIAAYALCGFANFASIGIQLGGLTSLAPERRGDLSTLALRAMLGGAFASWMTATIAGAFL